MKLSDLIIKLQEIEKESGGDLDCVSWNEEDSDGEKISCLYVK